MISRIYFCEASASLINKLTAVELRRRRRTCFCEALPQFCGLKGEAEWSWRMDLNHRPAVYETAALPTELRQPKPDITLFMASPAAGHLICLRRGASVNSEIIADFKVGVKDKVLLCFPKSQGY